MAARTNVTDKGQDELEEAEYAGGVPVHEDAELRVIPKQKGGAARTQNALGNSNEEVSSRNLAKNNGVIMPWDDTPNRFGDNAGKA